MPKISPDKKIKNTFEIGSEEMKSDYHRKNTEVTEKYKKNEKFRDSLAALDKIARKSGFECFVIKPGMHIAIDIDHIYETDIKDEAGNVIETKTGIFKENPDEVRVGDSVLDNLKDLFETDRSVFELGLELLLQHEKQHTEGESGDMTEKMYGEIVERIKLEDAKDFDTANKISCEVIDRDYPLAEQKAEVQRITKADYKDGDDFIDSQANFFTASYFVNRGFEYCKNHGFDPDEIKKYPGSGLVKKEFCQEYDPEEIKERILKRMEEMREDLVEKYERNKLLH